MPFGEPSPVKEDVEDNPLWESDECKECAPTEVLGEELPMTLKCLEMSLTSSLAKFSSCHLKGPSNINSIVKSETFTIV